MGSAGGVRDAELTRMHSDFAIVFYFMVVAMLAASTDTLKCVRNQLEICNLISSFM